VTDHPECGWKIKIVETPVVSSEPTAVIQETAVEAELVTLKPEPTIKVQETTDTVAIPEAKKRKAATRKLKATNS